MPREIKTREQFDEILPLAIEIRVVRSKGAGSKGNKAEGSKNDAEERDESAPAKVKIRTDRQLYTFKTTDAEVDLLVKGTKAEVIEY